MLDKVKRFKPLTFFIKSKILSMERKNMKMSNKFGTYLKNIRKNEGLTLKDVSDLIGMSQSFVSMVENGKTIPPLNILLDLCQILDIKKSTLLKLVEEDREQRKLELQEMQQEERLEEKEDEVMYEDIDIQLQKIVIAISALTENVAELVNNIKVLHS